MNLDDLLKSIREENGDSKGGKIDPDKLIQRRTYKAPAKFSSQSFRAPSIKPTPSRKLDADKLAPTETIQVGKDFLDKIDELIQVIKEDNELEKDRQDALDKEKARERRQTRENRIEVGKIFSGFTKGFKRVTGQFNDIINTVIKFLAFTVLGGLVKFLFDFLRNPKNKNFLKNVQKFFTVTLPEKFEEAKQKLGEIIKFFEETVPKIEAFAENFRQLLIRFPFLGELFKTKEEKKADQRRREQAEEDFGPFGILKGGGMLPFLGTDTVPAMLTPGEFVMSRGAVNMFGVDTMMAMNKAGGGTNRPKFGLISGFQGGGAVTKLPQKGADFWTLVSVAGTEDNDPQAWADVAQSIYNRSASGVYSSRNIRSLILAPGQYEPTWKHPRKKVERTPNPEWYDITDIESAAVATGKTVSYLQRVADVLQNPKYQDEARRFVGARTDFMGGNENANFAEGDVRRGKKGEDNFFGSFVGPGSRAYAATNPDPAAIPSFVGTKKAPPVMPVGPHFGPGFDSNDRAQSERLDLIELMEKNRAQQRADRSDINLDRLFNPIRRFFGVDTPNVPTSNSFMVLPTIDQPSDTGPTTQIATDIPEFDIVSGANMRGLYSQVLGIEDLT